VATTVKLISLNVSLFDENNEKLIHFLATERPDIVCLQEVSRKVDESAFDIFISKASIDNATLELSYSFFAPNWALRDFRQPNFHGKEFFEYDFGGLIEYGNYVKSRFKIISGKSVFVQGNFSYIVDWESFTKHPGEEPRTVEVTDLQIDTKNVRFLNYHGIWSKDKKGTDRTESASKHLLQIASEIAYPTIICGDFNLFPDTNSIKILETRFRSLVDEFNIMHTRPKSNELSGLKRNVVDYIFVDKDISVKKFEVINTDTSDHFPLLVEFQI